MRRPHDRSGMRAAGAVAVVAAACATACGPAVSEQSVRLAQNLVAMGHESYMRGDFGDALRKGLQAAEQDPTSPDAAYFVGFIHAAREEYADAERWLHKTLEIDDTYTDARNTLGQIYIIQGRHDEAVTILEIAARDMLYPEPHLVQANLGQAYLGLGRLDEAIDHLMRAVREQPDFCVAYYRLGDALQRAGSLERSEEALAAAVAVDDPACRDFQTAWRLLGEVRLGLGRLEAAAEAFGRCVDVGPATEDGRRCAAALSRIETGAGAER